MAKQSGGKPQIDEDFMKEIISQGLPVKKHSRLRKYHVIYRLLAMSLWEIPKGLTRLRWLSLKCRRQES